MSQNLWSEKETAVLIELRQKGLTVKEIAKELNRPTDSVKHKLDRTEIPLTKLKHDVVLGEPRFGYLPLRTIDSGEWVRIGLVSDTHLCCREERLDALHSQYDLFEKEKITTILHAGNIVDGYSPKINGASVICTGIDDQAQYVVDNYPSRKGVVTHFITANDHDAAWQGAKEGFNFGAYLSHVAETQGRQDLKYIGHVESDVEIKTHAKKSVIIRVAHPGGGCPYARSYVAQKVVESYEGGEKPNFLILGHHHVSNYLNERNIHVINMPGFQSQTIFGRTKRLRFEIGGAILEFKVNPEDGAVTRVRVEFNLYFDRTYYKTFLRSDKKLVKGHLVLTP